VAGLIVGLVGAGLYLFDDPAPLSAPRDTGKEPVGPSLAPALDISSRGASGSLGGVF